MDSELYINRVMVYPKLGRCDMKFRNGLNIIWSEDCKKEKDEFKSNLTNSVGKTTFVLIVDYILGKEELILSNNDKKKSIFNNRWIVCEVIFGKDKYTIVRSILDSEKIKVIGGWNADNIDFLENIDSYEDMPLDEYMNFIQKNIYKDNNVFNDKIYVSNRSIMSFLIRKQSVGFVKYNSGIEEENSKTRTKRLEYLLGLISDNKEELENEIDILKKEKKNLVMEKNTLSNYFKLMIEKSFSQLNREKLKNEKEIDKLIREQEKNKAKYDELQNELDILENDTGVIIKEIQSIEDHIYILKNRKDDYFKTIKDIDNELFKIKNINLAINIFLPFPVKKCPVYMKELDQEKGKCSYLKEEKSESEYKQMTMAREKILRFEQKDIKNAISSTESYIKSYEKQKEKLKGQLEQKTSKIEEIKCEIENGKDDNLKKINDLRVRNIIIDKDLENYKNINKKAQDISDKQGKIKKKQEELNKIIGSRVTELNKIYASIVDYITSQNRVGVINPKDYSPQIRFKSGGIDTGAAMANVAVIAFDIAMLELSLTSNEVSKVYPKFLVHDSPKLHDIQLDIYKKVMDYIIDLENRPENKEKSFQYILTTLDISDKVEKNKKTYIRLRMDNSGEGGKLFGCEI